MRTSRLSLPHMRLQIARSLALGHSQYKIALAVGCSQATISRLTRKPDLLKEVLRQKKRLVRRVPDAMEKLLSILDNPHYFDPIYGNKIKIGYQVYWTLLSLCYLLDKDGKGTYAVYIKSKALNLIVKKISSKQ